MFSLFKSKYFLKDLLPDNYIDIHNHLLAGIDDGAKTTEDTDSLIRQMKDDLNIAGAFATPHTFNGLWDNTQTSIKKAYDIAIESAENSAFLKGHASEYLLDASLIERIKKETLLCVKEQFVLVELHLFNNPIDLYEMLFELKLKDYRIIIAHPERYRYFHHNFEKFIKLKESGVYFQLNLMSLTGFYGKDIQKIAERMLDKGLYDFTGTDIHQQSHVDELITKPIPYSNKNKLGDLLAENAFFNDF